MASYTTSAADTSNPLTEVLSRLGKVTPQSNGQFSAKCPAHEDRKASLSISRGADGKVLLHCHAGCDHKAILAKLHLKESDLFAGNGEATRGKQAKLITKTYDYCDLDGQLLYQVCRFHPKDFRQRRPDGNGGWIWNLQGMERVLYRLPELHDAEPEKRVIICEGEKDVENLVAEGLVATCNVGGAGKWKAEYSETLRGRKVAVIPDNDKPGEEHAAKVADALQGIAAEVRIVHLPVEHNGHKVKDASDFLAAGGTAEQIRTLIDSAKAWTPDDAAPAADPLRTEYATELGNAQELVRRHGQDLRYDCDSGSWLVWTGQAWAEDRAGQAAQWSKAVARETWTRLQHLGSALAQKHASRMETAAGVRGVLTLAESEPNIPVRRTQLDADPFIFNCRNSIIDLRTGKARPHERADLCTRVAPVDYDPAATAPTWTKFLDRIMDGNAKLIAYLQRLAGLALTADATVHELAILFGTGANGKSVFSDTLVGLLGNYAAVAPDSLLIQRHHQEHPTEVADLCGRRLVVASENERGGRLRIQLVKKLTGDATLKARFMRQDFFEFPRTHKLWMLTNHKPRIDEDTEAVWRRIRLIPFSVTIPPAERDPHLLEKLALERPGIFNWAIAGCIDWQRRGMDPPPEVVAATCDYRGEADQLGDFFQERLIVGSSARVTRNDLFAAYREFADKAGDRHPMDRTDLFERARRIEGVTDSAWKVGGIVHRGFLGIGLVAPAQEGGAP